MLIEKPHMTEPVPTDPAIPDKFFFVKDAAQMVVQYAFAGDGVNALQVFMVAHKGGFTMAAICERACRYVARSYDYPRWQRKRAIQFICERATKMARLYGELKRNRRYEWC